MQKPAITARRIVELDLLRGFFIVIIILDHLQFWPSPFQYITGEGRLWASAAEGFFIISGLLIGYLRAYKGAHTPLKEISTKLWRRAGMLWVWCIIITVVVLALSVSLPGTMALLPQLPDLEQLSSLPVLLWNIVTLNYASDWIYFLRLYAIMLAITPLFLWLIRKQHVMTFVLLSLGAYVSSLAFGFNEGALQWQILFFGAALIGWKLETILAWLRQRPTLRTRLIVVLISTTVASMVLSYFMVHGWSYVESPATSITREAYVSIRANVDPLFSNNPMVLPRILLSFLWFGGLLALFHVIKKPLERWFGWLLLTFGQASLTAYCIQAVFLIFIVKLVQLSGGFWTNTLASILVIIAIWGLMKVPVIQKIFPK